MTMSLMLVMLTNNAYATDKGTRSRFLVPAENVEDVHQHEQYLPRHRLQTKVEKAHHGGGRGHHRDPVPVDGKSGKAVIASNITSLAASFTGAIVSEFESVSYGAKSGKEVAQSSTVPNSVMSSPDSGKTGKEAADYRQGEIPLPLPLPNSILSGGSSIVTVTEEIEEIGAKSGKPGGGDYYDAPASIGVSESNTKSGKTEGEGTNVTVYGDNIGMVDLGGDMVDLGGKTNKGTADADVVKPKASKAQGPLTDIFVKEPTSILAKSGKADIDYGSDKYGTYVAGGKSSKTEAHGSMSIDRTPPGSATLYDIIASDPNFSTLFAAVTAADLADILMVPGPLTLAAPTNDAFDALPEGFLDTLLLPENASLLQDALGYHTFAGLFPSKSITSGDVPTLAGDTVSVLVSDEGITINGANVILPDIIASNGIIHGIDAVLMPPEDPSAMAPEPSPTDLTAPAPPVPSGTGSTGPTVVVTGTGMTTLPPQPLLTLSPTLPLLTSKPPVAAAKAIEATVPTPVEDVSTVEEAIPRFPTYSPTGVEIEEIASLMSSKEGHAIALEPFGLRLFADSSGLSLDEDIVTRITEEHLIHSFRTRGYDVEGIKLMTLEPDRRLLEDNRSNARRMEQAYELIYGGVLHFPTSVMETPSEKDMETVVQESFSGELSAYYVQLLQESGVEVKKASLDTTLVPVADGFNWAGLVIGLSASLSSLLCLVFAARRYKRRLLSIDDLDLGKGKDENYTIRLRYTNDEIDGYPAATVAETMASRDQLSVPRLIKGIEEEINFISTPGGTNSFSSGMNKDKSKNKEGSAGSNAGEVSPLESPKGTSSQNASQVSSPRYISVFTVKKDCGGKTLDQINLRELVIAYLSRMMKKLPNTHLLPYDKKSSLSAIFNIRNIPDDIADLQHYVGNARVDDKTGKVMFNLRVEGDQPVSQMKSNVKAHDKLGLANKSMKKNSVAPVAERKAPGSPVDSQSSSWMGDVASKSPITPASMQDVDL